MNRRIKKKKGLIYSEIDLKIKEQAIRGIEELVSAVERRAAHVELPEEGTGPGDILK